MTPTTIRDNLKALSAYLLESTGEDFMYESVEQAIVLLGEGEWQGIESAPKDGTQILLAVNEGPHVRVGRWDEWAVGEYLWCMDAGDAFSPDAPTHWRPLPSPPK